MAGAICKQQKQSLAVFAIYTAPFDEFKQSKNPIFSDEVFTLVELAGTAPASAGLSWFNLSYRFSLFEVVSVGWKRTNK